MSNYVNQQWTETVSDTTTLTYVPAAGNFVFTSFSAGCYTVGGSNSVVELYWDQSGNQTDMQLVDAIYTSGNTYDNSENQNVMYAADGTAQFVVVMSFFNGGGARQIYAQVQGFTA